MKSTGDGVLWRKTANLDRTLRVRCSGSLGYQDDAQDEIISEL